jgi:hypothetical protein
MKRPAPYQHPAVIDLQLGADHMVQLSSFRLRAGVLMRNGTGFTIVPPVESINSQYWLIQSLLREGLQKATSVRLDPFLIQPENDFPCIEYRMWWYGVPLDWERIASLKREEHGRWEADSTLPRLAYTDYSWTPRGEEIHFFCEELPAREDVEKRGSRYFHAVYLPSRKKIIHLDGAIRIYNTAQWAKRYVSHVRNAGKMGRRIKVFRVDSEVSPDCLGSLCSSFFI